MTNNKMLIDASHPEETRVVVTRGNRIEEFDFESAAKRPLRGNIYLAKVTRVEPSLQAAFVDFGGNRHGFLAFSEIHPDYYQIPVADREALLAEDARAAASEDDELHEAREQRDRDKGRGGGRRRRGRGREQRRGRPNPDETVSSEVIDGEPAAAPLEASADGEAVASAAEAARDVQAEAQPSSEAVALVHPEPAQTAADQGIESVQDAPQPDVSAAPEGDAPAALPGNGSDDDDDDEEPREEQVESVGGNDIHDEVPRSNYRHRRQYKIQEVIRRRQIILVQVVKEERGTKGAALTTYLSLAGRYSVLMPNTARGGGISRKITSSEDRRRLKEMSQDLEVPEGMGVILRTAGASRTKAEVKRDFEYLLRVWEQVRETTLQSTAPSLVYEEGSLIKRAIRDLYSKEIEEVHVAGEPGFQEARDFMKMLTPSHVNAIKLYSEPQPMFARFGIESQLDAMFNNVVTLRSGGYIVINQTEALVAIDVNSGRSTREHNIEDTALRTNLEAAEEAARQLRLRDLAGLIVIDFIDMEESRNNKTVERRLKDCLKNDRARIQVGRISHFGLMEMSRQRMRTGVLEGSTTQCPHCAGSGVVRSVPSLSLHLLRAIEEQLQKAPGFNVAARTRMDVALYVLNQKRSHLTSLEQRFGAAVSVSADGALAAGQPFAVERGEAASGTTAPARAAPVSQSSVPMDDEPLPEEASEAGEPAEETEAATAESDGQDGERGDGRRRRRRRGGRGRNRENGFEPRDGRARTGDQAAEPSTSSSDEVPRMADAAGATGEAVQPGEEDAPRSGADNGEEREGGRRKRRRRGRRGARDADGGNDGREQPESGAMVTAESETGAGGPEQAAAEAQAQPREFEPRAPETKSEPVAVSAASPPAPEPEPLPEAAPRWRSAETVLEPEVEETSKPKRGGWWRR